MHELKFTTCYVDFKHCIGSAPAAVTRECQSTTGEDSWAADIRYESWRFLESHVCSGVDGAEPMLRCDGNYRTNVANNALEWDVCSYAQEHNETRAYWGKLE
jgi:hypothetical protein